MELIINNYLKIPTAQKVHAVQKAQTVQKAQIKKEGIIVQIVKLKLMN